MTEIKGFPLRNAFRKIIRNPVLKKLTNLVSEACILLFADHSFKKSIISCCAVRQKCQEKSQSVLAFGLPE